MAVPVCIPTNSVSREGAGNPLQYSCLENPMDGGAWWAAVYWVTQSWTWLMQLISSSSSNSVRGFPFSTPSPAFILFRLFEDVHSDRWEMMPHCGFDLHFSNNEWWCASFLVLLPYVYLLWRNMCLGLLPHFLISLLFWRWAAWAALYIFEINSLSGVSFAIIFSQQGGF